MICRDQYYLQKESRDNYSCYFRNIAIFTHLSYLPVQP
jgi:hypothetical protein